MYSASRPVRKPKKIATRFGNPLSAFASVDHETHRLRRSALNPFFSKRKIAGYVPQMQGRAASTGCCSGSSASTAARAEC